MIITCKDCGESIDDYEFSTACPHGRLPPDTRLSQMPAHYTQTLADADRARRVENLDEQRRCLESMRRGTTVLPANVQETVDTMNEEIRRWKLTKKETLEAFTKDGALDRASALDQLNTCNTAIRDLIKLRTAVLDEFTPDSDGSLHDAIDRAHFIRRGGTPCEPTSQNEMWIVIVLIIAFVVVVTTLVTVGNQTPVENQHEPQQTERLQDNRGGESDDRGD